MTFQWTRIIDSFGSSQADVASFTELPNGDDLESGMFVKDGTPTSYEEVWRDITGEYAMGTEAAWILQSVDGLSFLGRVGGIFIGMRQDQDRNFGVRKEVFDDAKGWHVTFESGSTDAIPTSSDVMRGETMTKGAVTGQIVSVAGGEYAVRGYIAL